MAHILITDPLLMASIQRKPSVAIPLEAESAFMAQMTLDAADESTEFMDTVAMDRPGTRP
jgi:hypothetical protein